MDKYKLVLVRLEGEVNRDWEFTLKDGTVEKYYSVEGSAQYGFGDHVDDYVWEHDQQLADAIEELANVVPIEPDELVEFTIDFDEYGEPNLETIRERTRERFPI